MQIFYNLFPGKRRANVGYVRPIYILNGSWDSLIDFKVLRFTFSKLYASLYAPDYVPLGLYLYELMHVLRHSYS